VRGRGLALPNVQAHEACSVSELETTADRRRITGVCLKNRQSGRGEETLRADLVVDASGRASRSPAWLDELGYGRPAEEEVRIGLGYTTCYYCRPASSIHGLGCG
jgi:hypothetical protein